MSGVSIRRGVVLFLLALVLRVSLVFVVQSYRVSEGSEVVNVAKTLATTGEFADAYGPGTGPTAHTAPVYPLLLSLIFRILGTGDAGEIGKEVFSSAIASLSCALLPSVGVAFGLGQRVGWWAGLWAALLPVSFYPETKGGFESALTGLSVLLVCLYFARTWAANRFSFREAVIGGIGVGLALLVSPSIAPVVSLLVVIGGWLFRAKADIYLRYAAFFGVTTLLMLTPWAVRNERVLGSPIFGRSNLGLELMVSNNDVAETDFQSNLDHGSLSRYHPFLNPTARADEIRLGEVAFQRQRLQEARAWILSHPARFAELTAARVALFWFPRMARAPQTVFMRLEALLGFAGYILLLRTDGLSKWLVGALWISYPTIYYIVQSYTRYRYPIEWSFILLGSFAILTALDALTRRFRAV